jgi:hypothetical protein
MHRLADVLSAWVARGVGRTSPGVAEYSDVEVELARRAQISPRLHSRRPLEIKTPSERAVLERLRTAKGKKEDR